MKFFTKGHGTGRKVIPLGAKGSGDTKYIKTFTNKEERAISKAKPFYIFSRHLKDLEQELKSELGSDGFAKTLKLYDKVSDPYFDLKQYLSDNDAWHKKIWSLSAIKRTFYDLPLIQYRSKVGIPQPEFLNAYERAFVIAGMKEDIPEHALYKCIIFNNVPFKWSLKGSDDKPVAYYRFFKDIDFSAYTKSFYKDLVFRERDSESLYIPEGMTSKDMHKLIKVKWNL